MLHFTKILILVHLYVLALCEIPDLNVRILDSTLIARKRQDTLDMCRIFTEENTKLEHTDPMIIESYNIIPSQTKRRPKREVEMKYAVNPALEEEDIKRVENIVDKLYDEMEARGESVAYKKNTPPTTTTTTTKKPTSTSTVRPKRRFFFAPAELISELHKENTQTLKHKNDPVPYEKRRWKHGIIPYFIDPKTYDAQLQESVVKAFDYIEKVTCIRLQRLREKPTDVKSMSEVDWLYITNPTGIRQCVHSNEKRKIDGVQMSVFGYDCMSLGDIVHEIMHVLGFPHEHTRSDRDQYITIFWDNIKPGYKKYFEISTPGDQYTLEYLPYDYTSVLHYPPRAFSKNGQLTLGVRSDIKIGQREGLSEIDVEKVGIIYAAECVERNREYLLKTCPSVVKKKSIRKSTQTDIEDYFSKRLWPYGLVHYKLRDKLEFTTEERENIKAVIRHIETETCIRFIDASDIEESNVDETPYDNKDYQDYKKEYSKTSNESIESEENRPIEKLTVEDFNIAKMPDVIDNDLKDPEIARKPIDKQISENEIIFTTDKGHVNKTRHRKDIKRPGAKKPEIKAGRRHADSILVLARSPEPGCKCPNPGKPQGDAVLMVNTDCFNSVNDLLHLFVHVLGLDHQHNMHDRDDYLHIVWGNITQDVKKELLKTLPPAASVGFDYDYQSVMHYPWLQIKNGVTNIMYPIWNDGWSIGNWQGLSTVDVQKLNLLYSRNCVEREKA